MENLRGNPVALALLAIAVTVAAEARAGSYSFGFAGAGVSGALTLSYGLATDSIYPNAFEVTGISGTFSDLNAGLGIVDASVASLVPITRDAPEPTNLLAPNDFSRFAVVAGLDHGALSFDNLFYPAGSPQTATDYPFHGGFLDIYGLLFTLGDGKVVNLWSNGDAGNGVIDYGVAVVTPDQALDYVGGVAVVPEPSTLWMLGAGLLGVLTWKRKKPLASSPTACHGGALS